MPYSTCIGTSDCNVLIYVDMNDVKHFYETPSYEVLKEAILDIKKYGADIRRLK